MLGDGSDSIHKSDIHSATANKRARSARLVDVVDPGDFFMDRIGKKKMILILRNLPRSKDS